MPIARPNDKRHDDIAALALRMLKLYADLALAKKPATKASFAAHIKTADARIDELVFALYGLDPDEIALVKGD